LEGGLYSAFSFGVSEKYGKRSESLINKDSQVSIKSRSVS